MDKVKAILPPKIFQSYGHKNAYLDSVVPCIKHLASSKCVKNRVCVIITHIVCTYRRKIVSLKHTEIKTYRNFPYNNIKTCTRAVQI